MKIGNGLRVGSYGGGCTCARPRAYTGTTGCCEQAYQALIARKGLRGKHGRASTSTDSQVFAAAVQVFAGAVAVIYNHPQLEDLILSRSLINAAFLGTLNSWLRTPTGPTPPTPAHIHFRTVTVSQSVASRCDRTGAPSQSPLAPQLHHTRAFCSTRAQRYRSTLKPYSALPN
jgi:hypothetical protein